MQLIGHIFQSCINKTRMMQMCQCGFVWNRVLTYIKHMTLHTMWGMTTVYYFSESHGI